MDTMAYAIRKLYRRFSRVLEQRLTDFNLTHPQWHFLTEIAKEEGLSQRELTDRVGVTAPTTVSALRVLERRGFIRRVQDPNDARSLQVYITAAGMQLRSRVRPILLEVERGATEGLSATDLTTFHQTMKSMFDNLDAAAQREDRPTGSPRLKASQKLA